MAEGDPRRSRSRIAWLGIVAALLAFALLVAGCGSSGSSSSSEAETTAPEASEEGGTENASSEGGGGGASLTKTYAPGVRTLEELYEGTEEEPPTSGPKAKKGASVIWVSCGQEVSGCKNPAEYFGEAAKALGWSYKIIDGKLNMNEGWANGIRTAIAEKPDVIITHGMNCPEVIQPLEEAKKAGILLAEAEEVDCNSPKVGGEKMYDINMEYSKNAKDTEEFYERYGEMQGQYLVDATEGKAKSINTSNTGLFGKNMSEVWEREIAKCAECEIVKNIEWEPADQGPNGPLFQKFSTALVQYPEANSALLSFDTNTTVAGLSKAIVDAGRNEMIAVGGEGTKEALAYLEKEEGLTAEPASHSGRWFAWGLADEINRVLNGQPTVSEGIGFKLVTKERNLPPKGHDYETEVPFQEAYEKIWSGK